MCVSSMTPQNDTQKKRHLTKPPIPVDTGWAWLIMLAAYANLMLIVAFSRALSILLPSILDRYQAPATVTTLAFGICDFTWSLTNIAIPTLLLPRFSIRSLALVGSIFHCLSVIALAYSPNITVFNCIFGVLGVAGGLIIVPSLIHLGHFFKKRLSFASSFSHAGGSTATVFIPLLTQFLLDTYGFQGAWLIIAGISFNCVATSMLLRPLSMYDLAENKKEHTPNDLEFADFGNIQIQTPNLTCDDDNEDERDVGEQSKFIENDDPKNKQLRETSFPPNLKITGSTEVTNGSIHQGVMDSAGETEKLIPNSDSELIQSTSNKRVHNELKETFLLLQNTTSDITVNHQTYTDILNNGNSVHFSKVGTVLNPDDYLKDQNSENEQTCSTESHCVQFNKNENSQHLKCIPSAFPQLSFVDERKSSLVDHTFNHTDPISNKESNQQDNDVSVTSSDRCCSIHKIKEYIRSSVLLNPVAAMLILAGGLSSPGGYMYLPILGLENGLTSEEVPWMLTIVGIADVVGKLVIGYLADLGYLRPIRIACMTQFTVGMMCQFTMFYQGFGPMAGMATIYGLTAGICQALLTPMIIEMVGLQYLAQLTPIYYLAIGVSTFSLNVSFGAIRDATGSFIIGFNLFGGMLLLSLSVLLLEPVFVRCRDRKSSK